MALPFPCSHFPFSLLRQFSPSPRVSLHIVASLHQQTWLKADWQRLL
jgi:hypothetical protein